MMKIAETTCLKKSYDVYGEDSEIRSTNLYGLYAYATQLEGNDDETERSVMIAAADHHIRLERKVNPVMQTNVYIDEVLTGTIAFGFSDRDRFTIFFENFNESDREWLFKPLEFDFKDALKDNELFYEPIEICVETN